MRSRLVPRGPPWRPNSWTVFFAGQQRGNRNSSLLHMRTLRYSLRRVSPLDSVNGGLITQRSVVQIHPPQPTSNPSGYMFYAAFFLGRRNSQIGSIGSNNEIKSRFACSQTSVFKFLIRVRIPVRCSQRGMPNPLLL